MSQNLSILPKHHLRTLYESFVSQIKIKKQIDFEMSPYLTNKEKTIGRITNFPEYISENLVVIILKMKGLDACWNRFNKDTGDLIYYKDGVKYKGEVKCKQNGPSQFSPSSKWETLFYVDATNHINNNIQVYMIENINNINLDSMQISKTQTFKDQKDEGRRPRFDISKTLCDYINDNTLIYNGSINDLLTD